MEYDIASIRCENEDEDPNIDYNYLNKLMGSSYMYDKRAVNALLSGLNQKILPFSIKEQFKNMNDLLLSGDFEQISCIAENIIEKEN